MSFPKHIAHFFNRQIWRVALKSVLSAWALIWTLNLSPQSGDTIFIAVPLAVLFWCTDQRTEHSRGISVLSAVLALFQTAVHYSAYCDFSTTYTYAPQLLTLIAIGKIAFSFVGWYIIFQALLGSLYPRLDNPSLASVSPSQPVNAGHIFFLSFTVIVFFRIPVFLACYPACFSSDTILQFKQAFGVEPLTGQHPIFHTMLLKLGYDIGFGLFYTPNAGAATCAVLQLLYMSAIQALSIAWLAHKGLRRGYLWVCIAFFSLLPFHAVWSVTLVKDIPFAGTMLLFTLMLCMLPDLEKTTKRRRILFFIAFTLVSVLLCLLRNAAVLILVLSLLFVILLVRKHRLFLIVSCVLTLSISMVVSLQSPSSDIVHALSIPLQQIARVITDGKSLEPEEKELLNHVIDVEEVPKNYVSWLSDPIKLLATADPDADSYLREHKIEFLQFYLRLGARYPLEYLKAYIDQVAGYLAPAKYWASDMTVVVTDTFLFTLGETKLPLLSSLFNAIEKLYKILPLYGLLSSVGFYIWIVLILFVYALTRKRMLLPFFPSLALWLYYLVAAPVFSEFRYIYPLIICVPLLIGLTLHPDKGHPAPLP